MGNGALVSIPTVNLSGVDSTNAIFYNGTTTGGTITSNVYM